MASSWAILYLWCSILLVSSVDHLSALPDEILPKRLLGNPIEAPPSPNESALSRDSIPTESDKQFTPIQPCGIQCFLIPPLYEMVDCENLRKPSSHGFDKPIHCSQHMQRGEIILGKKESVRGIIPGALESLVQATGENLLRTGQVSLHLNLNMLNLDDKVFQGLSTVVSELRILNTVHIHPDSLTGLQHLSLLEFETGRPPLTLVENTTEASDRLPAYFRLRLVDLSAPITFNMEVSCYRCGVSGTPLFVFFFKDNRRQITAKKVRQSGLNMVFPYSCSIQENAVGCPGWVAGNSSFGEDSPVSGSGGGGMDTNMDVPVVEDRTPSVLIMLSIWCTVLTVIVIIVVCILYFCSRHLRKIHKPRPTQKQQWFSNLCPYTSSSTEEVSSDSTNSAFIPKHTLSAYVLKSPEDQAAQTDLITTHNAAARSKSSFSLRDKPNMSLMTSTDRLDQDQSTRRNVGSQTDFANVDPELYIYSTLCRSQLNASRRSSYILTREPLSRTVSQNTLTRTRRNAPVIDMNTYCSRRQSSNLNNILMQLGHDPEVEFLMAGSITHPPAGQNHLKYDKRPPIYPNAYSNRRELGSSPVPWKPPLTYNSVISP